MDTQYVVRYPDATRPYKAGQGSFVLKIKSGTPSRWSNRACNTTDQSAADLCADLVEDLHRMASSEQTHRKGAAAALDALGVQNSLALGELRNRFIRARDENPELKEQAVLARILTAIASPPLTDLVEDWSRKPGTNQKYVEQMRTMLALKGVENDVSFFTRENCQAMLTGDDERGIEGLDCATETKKRYMVALRMFGLYLMYRGVIKESPIAQRNTLKVKYSMEERVAKEDVHAYTEAQVRAVLQALSAGPLHAMVALMFGAGVELGAVQWMKARDWDMENRTVTLYPRSRVAEGMAARKERKDDENGWGKTPHRRNRDVFVAHPEMWEIVKAYLATLKPNDWFLPRAAEGESQHAVDRELRKGFRQAAAAAKVEPGQMPFHNLRHAFAVYWIERGLFVGRCYPKDDQWLRDQLGHSNDSTLIYKTYGRRIKNANLKKIIAADLGQAEAAAAETKKRGRRQGISHLAVV